MYPMQNRFRPQNSPARAGSAAAPRPSTAVMGVRAMRLLLIRHAETGSNVAGLLDTTVPGPGLTPLGEQQSRELVSSLSGESIEAIYASSHLRTSLTAQPLATALTMPIHIHNGLREVSAGQLEMRGDLRSIDIYVTALRSWCDGDLESRIPGGENGHEFLERYDTAIEEVASAGLSVAVVFVTAVPFVRGRQSAASVASRRWKRTATWKCGGRRVGGHTGSMAACRIGIAIPRISRRSSILLICMFREEPVYNSPTGACTFAPACRHRDRLAEERDPDQW